MTHTHSVLTAYVPLAITFTFESVGESGVATMIWPLRCAVSGAARMTASHPTAQWLNWPRRGAGYAVPRITAGNLIQTGFGGGYRLSLPPQLTIAA